MYINPFGMYMHLLRAFRFHLKDQYLELSNGCLTRLTSGYFQATCTFSPYKIVKCKLICNKGMNKVVVVCCLLVLVKFLLTT